MMLWEKLAVAGGASGPSAFGPVHTGTKPLSVRSSNENREVREARLERHGKHRNLRRSRGLEQNSSRVLTTPPHTHTHTHWRAVVRSSDDSSSASLLRSQNVRLVFGAERQKVPLVACRTWVRLVLLLISPNRPGSSQRTFSAPH